MTIMRRRYYDEAAGKSLFNYRDGTGMKPAPNEVFGKEGAVADIGDIGAQAPRETADCIVRAGGRAFSAQVDVTQESSAQP
jgi:hypothetical protein